jgi:hypothetical protein
VSTRQDLLDLEAKAWLELCDRFNALKDDDWEQPGVVERWNAKDLMAHIACWHAEAVHEMEMFRSQGHVKRRWSDVDQFNAELYEQCKDMSLHDVKVMSGASRHRFREETALAQEPLPEKMERLIAANGHEHYEEHLPHLDAFLGKRRA